jgi:DNA-binding NtrC family response regulator
MLLKDAMKTFEKQYVGTVLESVSWNRTKAAEILGIHRNTLASKLGYLGLTP